MMIVDQGYDRPPELRRDPFWDEVHPLYSEESSRIPNHLPRGSVSHVKLASSVSEVVMMPHSRAEFQSTPAFPTAGSIRKSKNVKVKDDERDLPQQYGENRILRRIVTDFKRVFNYISPLTSHRSLILNKSKEEEKLPVKTVKISSTEPAPLHKPTLDADIRPISIAIPTESPMCNEKYVE
uniref:Bestrophin domain containing protein n=1 Tax=Haemonchus contortus TaxID=6289 RepID=W6NE26_HAECO